MSDDAYDDDLDATTVESSPRARTSSDENSSPEITAAPRRKQRKQRTSPRQFLREVRSELRKVAWPARKELISYSIVVLVSVSIITVYITALDQAFGALILRMFGS
jgi:preprotein translocase subunit SecE